ncbi:MAG: glutamyl-tRNA reductase, partial [Bacteroidota bacterium]
MDLFSVGISHKRAPIEVREKLWFSRDEIPAALKELIKRSYKECVIISTCNRTEAYVVSPAEEPNVDALRDFLIKFKNARSAARPEHFYSFISCGVANHLFEVSAGIDSMIVGDVQILGQVKDAFSLSKEAGTNGFYTNRLFQCALHVGKRTRTETEIGEGAVSISYAAVELASKIFAHLDRKTILLIGAGKTGELTAKHLISKGAKDVIFANRTRRKAEELAQGLGGRIVDFTDLRPSLHEADIVISSISPRGYVLTAQDIQRVARERGNSPLVIIDIGVPRNIDPVVNRIRNVFLHDIDALQRIVGQNLEKRMR